VISREIARNGEDKGRGRIIYTAKMAEEKRLARRQKANRKHIKLLQDKAMYNRFFELFKEHHKYR
jgi:IS30 family transposase